MAGSNVAATICTWYDSRRNQINNLSDSQKKGLKVVATVITVGTIFTCGYFSGATLFSQAADACDQLLQKKKRKLTLFQAISSGLVTALFDYDGSDDTHDGTEHYSGYFHGDLQYGSFYDTISKEWETCWRKINRIQIGDKCLKVPRALLSALADGSIVVNQHDELETVLRYSPAKHDGLHQVLESQAGRMKSFRLDKRDDLPMPDEQSKSTNRVIQTHMVVDAGLNHTVRTRASKPSTSSFSMDQIFRDDTTYKEDVKFLRAKFMDENRNHFAYAGSSDCNVKQDTPLSNLMREMKVSIPSSDGFSVQETVQTVSSQEDDGIGV